MKDSDDDIGKTADSESTAIANDRRRAQARKWEKIRKLLGEMAEITDAFAETLVKTRAKRHYIDFMRPHPEATPDKPARIRELTPKGTSRAAAELRARELWVQCLEEENQALRCPTFADFVTKRWWLKYPYKGALGRQLKPHTIKGYFEDLQLHLLPRFGDEHLDDIDHGLIDEFATDLFEKGLGGKRVRNIVGTLSAVLNTAVRWGVLADCPLMPKIDAKRRAHDYLRIAEKERLLAAVDDRVLRTAFLLCLETGLRPGEALALRPQDLNLEQRTVTVRLSRSDYTKFILPPLDGNQSTAIFRSVGFKEPKDDEERTIPLTRRLARNIRRHLDLNQARLFPFSQNPFNIKFKAALHAAGITRSLRAYDMRHSFATLLALRGVKVQFIQYWLGHSDIKMTQHYARVKPEPGDIIAAFTGNETERDLLDLAFGDPEELQ